MTEEQTKYLATYVSNGTQFPKLMRTPKIFFKFLANWKLKPNMSNAITFFLEDQKPPELVPLFSEIIGAPWKIPRTLPDARKINLLLERNMAHQMDSLPETEFDDCFSSGDSLGVCYHLLIGLEGIAVRSQFNVGLLKVGDEALPMVWLTIHGTLIDNTYHHWPGMDKKEIESRLRTVKKIEHYIEEDPTTTEWPLINQLGSRSCVSDPRLLKAFGSREKIGQLMAFRHGQPNVYPNFSLYSQAFCREPLLPSQATRTREELEKSHFIYDVWNCWFCNKVSKSLKTCKTCNEGLYCDKKCQRADWPDHKLLHQDREANKIFQEEAVRKRDAQASKK